MLPVKTESKKEKQSHGWVAEGSERGADSPQWADRRPDTQTVYLNQTNEIETHIR